MRLWGGGCNGTVAGGNGINIISGNSTAAAWHLGWVRKAARVTFNLCAVDFHLLNAFPLCIFYDSTH